ncbi:DBF4-type zinc finger-containing protein 2 isoform X1 [Cyprinodon tularosa]|uniref:DBF4-type zinc finger-containing protein 2 isoform X1 n=1 Tax=Cyprinodon tularosa TaxID=77115 RepID=UPI0018E206A2|nr:DBF4-type zinc finger-containing protein 2 isoform X1 [Cyprinodon tularosa]
MPRPSDEGHQKKAEPPNRRWAEPEAGPSRCEPGRQGYCGYCRVLYTHLEQHLSSLRHLDAVSTSSRGSSPRSSSRSGLTLLERFLQDVQEHHPHRYGDGRPSHADLPSVSTPLLPKVELDEVCSSDSDSSAPPSDQPPREGEEGSQSGDRAQQDRLSSPSREPGPPWPRGPQAPTPPPQAQNPPPQTQTPPPVHRKAHRKTNRRKPSESSSSTRPSQRPGTSTDLHRPSLGPRFSTGARPPAVSWQKVQMEEARVHRDPVEQTIEQVIQMCCYSCSAPPHQQEDHSLPLSLPVSMETLSEDWDAPVQGVFQRAGKRGDTAVQVAGTEGRHLGRLMDVQVDLEDQLYSSQLDSALLGGGIKQDQGFWNIPIEDVLPVPQHIPKSFRGKTWTQIEQEDEERVERLVQQFRRGKFICYFDSESLARFGRSSRRKKELTEAAEPDVDLLPLAARDEDDSACVRKRRRGFRLASRCQVVKVSHSTQTVRMVIPTVHQLSSEAPPPNLPAANERTPETQMLHSLPPCYSSIVSPVQPRTSLIYLLCGPPCSVPTSPEGSAPKRCRRRRRPVDLQRFKVKYKRLPVKFYEPGTNQILRSPPQRALRPRGSAPSGQPPPPCVRQLFRSLSPDLNMDRRPEGGPKSDATLLGTLSGRNTARRRGRTPSAATCRSQRGGRPRPPQSQRRTQLKTPPPPPRREGLRRAAPSRKPLRSPGSDLLPPRRGRSQRGRGCERGGR